MYVSPTEIQAVRLQSLDVGLKLGQSYLDSVEHYFKLSSALTQDVMNESAEKIDAIPANGKVADWFSHIGNLNQRLLTGHVSSLLSGVVHVTAKGTEEAWEATENQINETGKIARKVIDRGLNMAPWETFWLLNSVKSSVAESLATANKLSQAAITVSARIDKEVQAGISASISQ